MQIWQQRWSHINQPTRTIDLLGMIVVGVRPVNNRRNMDCTFVDEVTMAGLAVIAKTLAVVIQKHHN